MGFCLKKKNPNELQGEVSEELNRNLPGRDMNGDGAAVGKADPVGL